MRIVYEGLRAGQRPPRGITVQGGELAGIYRFEPHGEPVELDDHDGQIVLALRPQHGRFRSLDGVAQASVVSGGSVDELAGDEPTDKVEPDADEPIVPSPDEVDEPAAAAPAGSPQLGLGVSRPAFDPDARARNGRNNRRGRPRGFGPEQAGGKGANDG